MIQQQNILALDAAFGPACAALIREDGKQFHASSPSDKPHSQTILPMLASMLDEAELDWGDLQLLGVGIGPGSFTGLRIAAAIMSGINAGFRLPILELSSLAITAQQSRVREPVWVIEDARADSAWIGRYQEGISLGKDRSQPWDEVRRMPMSIYLTQMPGAVTLPEWRHIPLEIPRCKALATLLCQYANLLDIQSSRLPHVVTPVYLSPSQAERNAQKP